jgi:SNF2 family DNA or RNA helicase
MMIKFEEYDQSLRAKVQKIPGARFVGPTHGGPGFRIQLDMQTCDELLREFGNKIRFSPEVLEWGRAERAREARLTQLAAQDDSRRDFSVLERKLAHKTFFNKNTLETEPLWPAFRADQRLGVQWLDECPNPLLADEAGLGKTWQIIAAMMMEDGELGRNLVICPKISIESVWLTELNTFQDEMVFVAPEGRKQRDQLLEEVQMCLDEDIPFWLVVNPAMVGLRRTEQQGDADFYDHVTGNMMKVQFPFLFEVEWDSIIIDEAHLSGLPNPSSQFSRAIKMMKTKKRIAMSGTPMGGKPERLWGTLHWLEPKDFTSKHTWLKRWAKQKTFEVDGRTITTYEGLKGKLEERFYEEHRKYMLRRKKEDVVEGLLPKTQVDVWVEMTPKQAKQYALMEEEAFAQIMEAEEVVGRVSMANVLATNTWLKQFANAYCDLEEKDKVWNDLMDDWETKYRAVPTTDGPKLEALWTTIQEIGVDDIQAGKQMIVFSQFRRMAELAGVWLAKKGLSVAMITGGTSRKDREQIIKDFQAGGKYQVVIMTTKAGGVSITLDKADDVVFLDETYDPDDQSQASDRAHRAGYIHAVTVYTIRTKGTIEEDVLAKLRDKQNLNDILLDRYRQAKERAGK